MPRRSKQEQELGYFRAAWDEIRVMEADFTGNVEIRLNPTQRPGVFNIQMKFTQGLFQDENAVRQESITVNFPDASQSMFSGMIWHLAMQLSRQVLEAQNVVKPKARKRGGGA